MDFINEANEIIKNSNNDSAILTKRTFNLSDLRKIGTVPDIKSIKLGDTVRMASGSPPFIVEKIEIQNGETMIFCSWINGNEINKDWFNKICLIEEENYNEFQKELDK